MIGSGHGGLEAGEFEVFWKAAAISEGAVRGVALDRFRLVMIYSEILLCVDVVFLAGQLLLRRNAILLL